MSTPDDPRGLPGDPRPRGAAGSGDLPPALDPRRPRDRQLRRAAGPARQSAAPRPARRPRPPRRGRRAAPEPPLPRHLDPRGGRRSADLPRAGGSRALPRARLPRPAAPPTRAPHRFGRFLSWVAVGLSVAIFAVAALGYVFYRRYDGNIERLPGLTQALPGLSKPGAAPGGARNVLLVGSDTRDTTGDEFQGTGREFTSGQRSDTVILAHLYGGSDQAQLVSFPRDSWVTVPAYRDPATGTVHPEHSAKLNSAIELGGPALLIATIERLTDIRVDNYVQIDFAGFQTMVEKLGGVEVCLRAPAKERDSGIDLPAGRQVVKGAQALAFVRQRKELPNGDIDRIRRQQAFIGSITRKVLSSGTLLDPFKLNGFLEAATSSVKVDESLSGSGLTALALRMRNFDAGGVVFTTVPFTDISATRGGQSVVLLDDAKAGALFEALDRDQAPQEAAAPEATAASQPLTVGPRSVRVSVFNGAGTAGLGRRAADDLAARGFSVVGAPGNRGDGATGTVIRFGPTRSEAARTLAASVPGAALEQDPALGGTLEVVVGSSWAGAQAVTVGPAGPSAAPATPAAEAPAVTAASDGCVD